VNDWRVAISLALGLLILWRNLPGALMFLRPGLVRVRRAPEDALDEPLFAEMEGELAPLGFRRLGAHLEKAPLRRPVLSYDFVNEAEHTFGSAFRDGGVMRLYLLTPFSGGGFVLTADHRRTGVERGDYLAGGLPGAGPDALLAAHRRRVERLVREGRQPLADLSMDAREQAAVRWHRGAGARELRLRNANQLILCLMGVAILVAVVGDLFRAG
jgi:hypothetical protein